MRVLVTGSRSYTNKIQLAIVLSGLAIAYDRDIDFVQGNAKNGADRLCRMFCRHAKLPCYGFTANWDKYGKPAGMIRNRKMLVESEPDLVVAFFASRTRTPGTSGMVNIAEKAGVPVWEIFDLESGSAWSPNG